MGINDEPSAGSGAKPIRELLTQSIKNNQDVLRIVETNGVVHPELQLAIKYIQAMALELGLTEEQQPTPEAIIKVVCNSQNGAESLVTIFRKLDADQRPNLPREKIREQLVHLAEIAKRTIAMKQARSVATIYPSTADFGFIAAKDAVDAAKNMRIKVIEAVGPSKEDTITAIYPEGDRVTEQQVNNALKSFQTVWDTVRCTQEKRSCRILFTKMDNGKRVRAFGVMNMNPDVIIDLNDPGYLETAVHEGVHATFGEAGRPLSLDFMEGCATRLAFAFTRGKTNLPSSYLLQKIQEDMQKMGPVRSSTALLENPDEPKNKLSAVDQEMMKYVFGYVLVDTLVKNSVFQRLSERRTSETSRPYQLLMDLNKAMAEYPTESVKDVHSRDVVAVGLKRVGYSDGEIVQFFAELNTAFETLPTTVSNEYRRNDF